MSDKTKNALILTSAMILQFIVLIALLLFSRGLLMSMPLPVRAVLSVALQWALLIVPLAYMRAGGERFPDIGFSKNNLPAQILTGAAMALAMSLFFTIVPILLGFRDSVGTAVYTKAWQFLYQFVYMIAGVAFAEEVFFRGFLYKRLAGLAGSKWFAAAVSSLIFGLSHIFNGNILQVILTALLGMLFCVCRDKIKHCTTLSLIIAHGCYNGLITLFVAVL